MKFMTLLLGLTFAFSMEASTAFLVKGTSSSTVAKSYDWPTGHGMVVINKRNVLKNSFLYNSTSQSIQWTSKFGSVTFNQFGTEMPTGGINERGLVIESLIMPDTKYENADGRNQINELQWIQYQLDNYESVTDVISNIGEFNILGTFINVHYLVCDRSKSCIVIDIVDGKKGMHLNAKALTNNSYKQLLEHLALFEGFGGTLPIPTDNSSLSRFVKINDQILTYDRGMRNNVIEASFTMLNSVRHGMHQEGQTTVWNIVYDLEHLRVHFVHTLVGIKKFINIDDVDFSCETPRKVYNIESYQGRGDVMAAFVDYKKSLNKKIILQSLTDANRYPTLFKEKLTELPETFSCQK